MTVADANVAGGIDENGVLYGGDELPLIEPDARSMGEVVLRRLAASGDAVVVVSILDSSSVNVVFIGYFSNEYGRL